MNARNSLEPSETMLRFSEFNSDRFAVSHEGRQVLREVSSSIFGCAFFGQAILVNFKKETNASTSIFNHERSI